MIALPLLLAVLLATGFLGLLVLTARNGRPWRVDGQSFTLRHSAVLRWFSIAALFGGVSLFAAWAMIAPPQSAGLLLALVAAATALAVLGLALVWESFQWKLVVSRAGVVCHSPWRGIRRAAWADVVAIDWLSVLGWYVIRFRDGGRFRVPGIVPGYADLMREWQRESRNA